MRLICWLLLGAVLTAAGCSTSKSSTGSNQPAKAGPIVTPSDRLTGRISLVNKSGRYVIVSLPIGRLSAADRGRLFPTSVEAEIVRQSLQGDQSYAAVKLLNEIGLLSIYRNGLKVGEAKVNGPQIDNLVTADIVAGDCRVGDEARWQ